LIQIKLPDVYYESEPGRRSAAKLLSKDEARRIATNIAKLPVYRTTHDGLVIVVRSCSPIFMRAVEARAHADEMIEVEPKAIMLRIAADYEELAEWAEKNSTPFWLNKKPVFPSE
jgi:hypothetical protein